MTKTEIYNKMKQAYYQLDIEAVQARIFALDGVYTDWLEIAERKETESQGVFNAMIDILPNWSRYESDQDTLALSEKLYELKGELKQLTELEAVA